MRRAFQPAGDAYRWNDVDVLEYKEAGSAPFRSVTRSVLFEDAELGFQWRYFEVGPGGYTTLERHEHVHAVMIVRGSGKALVGTSVHDFTTFDLFRVPPMTWHQFRASDETSMGFLCLVPVERDRPQLPSDDELAELRRHSDVAAFLSKDR
ncbi:MAG: cupin domain-containing protein [Vulcanimicrobiaceae bacterium]